MNRDWDELADELGVAAVADGDPTRWYDELWSAAARGEVSMPWDRTDAARPARRTSSTGPTAATAPGRGPWSWAPATAPTPSTSLVGLRHHRVRHQPGCGGSGARALPGQSRSTTGSPTCSTCPRTSWVPSTSSSRSTRSRRCTARCARVPYPAYAGWSRPGGDPVRRPDRPRRRRGGRRRAAVAAGPRRDGGPRGGRAGRRVAGPVAEPERARRPRPLADDPHPPVTKRCSSVMSRCR